MTRIETPKQEAFRLSIEAQEADICKRMAAASMTNDWELIYLLIDELHACQQERKHFDRWHGEDATVDDSYASRTR